ncbi:glycosyltransferase family A protein [Streptococcus lutetiensis]|jgi:hypothetical protein|uniref:glycosyltransferase family A protein n=1 Tax=Streptococcus lutetiensis TaxID=150055 RepID=UPI000FE24A8E|nr:glycosyltransferase family A protein [Streptococcus lutetiensis]RHB86911.1 glycosyltransferase family 2 protein [Streptococcus lutetiensis]
MISVITIYNDKNVLENTLLKSIAAQENCEYETILVDTYSQGFTSASSALNFGASLAKGDYLVFIHQDVKFEENDTLNIIEEFCKQNEFGIAGVAGLSFQKQSISKIYHGKNRILASKKNDFNLPVEAISLDECLLIVPKKSFDGFSDLGDTWHLYGTDYTLKMKNKGKNALIFPITLWHKSDGISLNLNYFDSIKSLCHLYRKEKVIYTLFGYWPTNPLKLNIKVLYRKFRFKKWGR